uniref:Uncharacterized protein n=1 Tax=Anguilla anguilla TaxID=7936 RepID=A0A0E9XPL6_ANGAN
MFEIQQFSSVQYVCLVIFFPLKNPHCQTLFLTYHDVL